MIIALVRLECESEFWARLICIPEPCLNKRREREGRKERGGGGREEKYRRREERRRTGKLT